MLLFFCFPNVLILNKESENFLSFKIYSCYFISNACVFLTICNVVQGYFGLFVVIVGLTSVIEGQFLKKGEQSPEFVSTFVRLFI